MRLWEATCSSEINCSRIGSSDDCERLNSDANLTFSRSTFLLRLMPPGITVGSPAGSSTQAPAPAWVSVEVFALSYLTTACGSSCQQISQVGRRARSPCRIPRRIAPSHRDSGPDPRAASCRRRFRATCASRPSPPIERIMAATGVAGSLDQNSPMSSRRS
jgi:hypothetical protein